MDEEKPKLISSFAIFFDLILAVGFFFFMLGVCRSHVPIETEPANTIIAAYTSFCLSSVFWTAVQLLRVTWVDQIQRKKAPAITE